MPRPRYVKRLRLLFNLLLFTAIIAEHRAAFAVAAAADVAIDPELSSPSPFTVAPTDSPTSTAPTTTRDAGAFIVAAHDEAGEQGNIYNDTNNNNSSSSTSSTIPPSNALDVNAYAVNGVIMDTNNVIAAVADSGAGDETDETDLQLNVAAPTPPASVEQQDQPLVPPTTLSFANIAPADGRDGDLFKGGSIAGFELGEGDEARTATTTGDATPPYAAVDEKYGKYMQIFVVIFQLSSNFICKYEDCAKL
ncbi:unnamed protein product [Ceratitis capitata]|uniref:(Mediterranean fruit fly) hypothetical protein n=1 Tax=Ceratitis capitata TaxID=7213 RepID=A0A811U0H1_CERCA|nr:unnamed protein product [Ceratitis capitata]